MRKIINLERFIKNKTIREWLEALIFAGIVALIFRTWLYAPYRVPTGSMIHTIEIGDHIFVNKHSYGFIVPFTDYKLFPKEVHRKDIVVFPYPEDPSIDFIKRVIAIGGDEVEIIGEKVYINGNQEIEPYLYYDKRFAPVPGNRKFKVPDGNLWVMGDNRRNSKDSRYWGFVEEKMVQGKGMIIYWSHDPSSSIFGGYKLERIAKSLD
ncbi:MAG: signal peptidase I [Deltaproteobacteria bacterium]|nr:signal peptidase I [Deltaproteobacteria bacterium]